MSYLTTNEAAKELGVSGATIRNWCRAGYLEAALNRPLSFASEEIHALKERIRTNRFNRLRKRANKSASEKVAGPEIDDPEVAADLARLVEIVAEQDLDPAQFLYLAALRCLEREGEVRLQDNTDKLFMASSAEWKRQPVRDIMAGWQDRLSGPISTEAWDCLDSFLSWGDCEDRLGLLYQALSSVGRKSRTGAYFTPGHIIDASLEDFGPHPRSFLDPCCGTGRYLIRAASRFGLEPDKVHGFDSDPVAVDIARINLLLNYPDLDSVPNVRCLDSLHDLANGQEDCDTNHLLGAIDAIATNPPWGGCKNQTRHRNLVALIKSGESFSLFLEKSLRLVREGGLLSFILPEAVLKIKAHSDIRRLLVTETRIRKITLLGRVFSGVFTPIMRLDVEKRPAHDEWMVIVVRGDAKHHAPQSRFVKNHGHAFDVAVAPNDEELLAKIYRVEHQTLRHQADWALGIVTGDNARYVLETPVPGSEPILRGRDIYKFASRAPRCHIEFKPEVFQQVAPERYYRAGEKLVYRFVSDRLVFAYDDKGTLTLNSANILIPRLPHLSVKAALAFLNSRVFQYVFTKRFRTRKVLRGDLEMLPFPVVDSITAGRIEEMVDRCMSGDYEPAEELDRLVFGIFGLDAGDVEKMEASMAAEAGSVIL